MIVKDAENDCLMGFAHNGNVATCFMNSALQAFVEDARKPTRRLTEYFDAAGPYIHDNRARIARYFLECTDKQWLWMVDNDIQFPADSLDRLLEAAEKHDARIVGAAYWNQYAAGNCFLSWLVFTPDDGICAVPELPDEDIAEVTAVGMGCTLIHRDVIKDVADMYAGDPWDTFAADILLQFEEGGYMVGRTPEDLDPALYNGRTVKTIDRMGEDVTMCVRARRAGYLTYGLPSLVVEHFKPHLMRHGSADRSPAGVS